MNSRTRKIRLVVGISDFRIGGAQKIVADIINLLNKEIFEVHLITFVQSEEENFYHLLPKKITIHKCNFTGLYDLKSWLKLRTLLIEIKPDVVWSHLFFSSTVLRVLKLFVGYKVVTVEHNTNQDKFFFHKLVDFLLSFFTHKIVAVSSGVAKFISNQEKISKDKFITIPNGVDVGHFQDVTQGEIEKTRTELNIGSDKKIIICIGQFIEQKNHRLLIEAFNEFVTVNTDHVLVIIGDGGLRSQLELQVKNLGIEDKVKLPGIKIDVAPILATGEMFVLPSLFEGFGIVCIEAMAAGLPVVSTRVTGPDLYVKNGKNGFLCDTTKSDLICKMQLLAGLNEQEKIIFSTESEKTAIEYDLSKTVKQYEFLFASAVQ